MGELRDPLVVEPLVQIIQDRSLSGNLRKAAAYRLVANYDSDDSRLNDALTSRAVGPLVQVAQDHEEVSDVRRATIEALGSIRDELATPLLTEIVEDTLETDKIRATALAALGYVGDRRESAHLAKIVGDLLAHENEILRASAVFALGCLYDASYVEDITGRLSDRSATVRAAAAHALGSLTNVGVASPLNALIMALGDGEIEVVLAAAQVLGWTHNEKVVEPLIALLQHSSSDVRKGATWALYALKSPAAIEALEGIAANVKEDTAVRVAAFTALEEIGVSVNRAGERPLRPLTALRDALQDADPQVRERAAHMLGAISDLNAVEMLIGLLDDVSEEVRSSTAWALGELGDSRAVGPLIQVLREASLSSDRNEWLGFFYAEALEKLNDSRAVEPLIEALQASSPTTVWRSAWALGRLRDQRAVEPLLEMLNHSDPSVRFSAANSLGEIGDSAAVQPLIELLNDQDSGARRHAVTALAKLGDARALPSLCDLQQHMQEGALEDPYGLDRAELDRAIAYLQSLGHGLAGEQP